MRKIIPNWLIWAFAIISYVGFMDATYLTVAHLSGAELNCAIFTGCNQVTQSAYSEIFGIPVALFGALFYLAIFLSTLLYFVSKKKIYLRFIPFFTTLGFLFSLVLIYLQIYVIKAICIYCMFSALTTTLLFALSLYLIIHKKEVEEVNQL